MGSTDSTPRDADRQMITVAVICVTDVKKPKGSRPLDLYVTLEGKSRFVRTETIKDVTDGCATWGAHFSIETSEADLLRVTVVDECFFGDDTLANAQLPGSMILQAMGTQQWVTLWNESFEPNGKLLVSVGDEPMPVTIDVVSAGDMPHPRTGESLFVHLVVGDKNVYLPVPDGISSAVDTSLGGEVFDMLVQAEEDAKLTLVAGHPDRPKTRELSTVLHIPTSQLMGIAMKERTLVVKMDVSIGLAKKEGTLTLAVNPVPKAKEANAGPGPETAISNQSLPQSLVLSGLTVDRMDPQPYPHTNLYLEIDIEGTLSRSEAVAVPFPIAWNVAFKLPIGAPLSVKVKNDEDKSLYGEAVIPGRFLYQGAVGATHIEFPLRARGVTMGRIEMESLAVRSNEDSGVTPIVSGLTPIASHSEDMMPGSIGGIRMHSAPTSYGFESRNLTTSGFQSPSLVTSASSSRPSEAFGTLTYRRSMPLSQSTNAISGANSTTDMSTAPEDSVTSLNQTKPTNGKPPTSPARERPQPSRPPAIIRPPSPTGSTSSASPTMAPTLRRPPHNDECEGPRVHTVYSLGGLANKFIASTAVGRVRLKSTDQGSEASSCASPRASSRLSTPTRSSALDSEEQAGSPIREYSSRHTKVIRRESSRGPLSEHESPMERIMTERLIAENANGDSTKVSSFGNFMRDGELMRAISRSPSSRGSESLQSQEAQVEREGVRSPSPQKREGARSTSPLRERTRTYTRETRKTPSPSREYSIIETTEECLVTETNTPNPMEEAWLAERALWEKEREALQAQLREAMRNSSPAPLTDCGSSTDPEDPSTPPPKSGRDQEGGPLRIRIHKGEGLIWQDHTCLEIQSDSQTVETQEVPVVNGEAKWDQEFIFLLEDEDVVTFTIRGQTQREQVGRGVISGKTLLDSAGNGVWVELKSPARKAVCQVLVTLHGKHYTPTRIQRTVVRRVKTRPVPLPSNGRSPNVPASTNTPSPSPPRATTPKDPSIHPRPPSHGVGVGVGTQGNTPQPFTHGNASKPLHSTPELNIAPSSTLRIAGLTCWMLKHSGIIPPQAPYIHLQHGHLMANTPIRGPNPNNNHTWDDEYILAIDPQSHLDVRVFNARGGDGEGDVLIGETSIPNAELLNTATSTKPLVLVLHDLKSGTHTGFCEMVIHYDHSAPIKIGNPPKAFTDLVVSGPAHASSSQRPVEALHPITPRMPIQSTASNPVSANPKRVGRQPTPTATPTAPSSTIPTAASSTTPTATSSTNPNATSSTNPNATSSTTPNATSSTTPTAINRHQPPVANRRQPATKRTIEPSVPIGPTHPLAITLMSGDALEAQAPYVELRVDDRVQYSSVIKGDPFPEWNETFEFLLSPTASLEVILRDAGRDGDRHVGKALISFEDLQNVARRSSYTAPRLLNAYGTPTQASILLHVAVSAGQDPPACDPNIKDGPQSVTIKVVGAEDLSMRAWPNPPHPYAVLKMGGRRMQTSTRPTTLYPSWGDAFHFWVREEDSLQVEVFDALYNDELIGEIAVPIPASELLAVAENNEQLAGTLIERRSRAHRGNIVLEVLWHETQAPKRPMRPPPPGLNDYFSEKSSDRPPAMRPQLRSDPSTPPKTGQAWSYGHTLTHTPSHPTSHAPQGTPYRSTSISVPTISTSIPTPSRGIPSLNAEGCVGTIPTSYLVPSTAKPGSTSSNESVGYSSMGGDSPTNLLALQKSASPDQHPSIRNRGHPDIRSCEVAKPPNPAIPPSLPPRQEPSRPVPSPPESSMTTPYTDPSSACTPVEVGTSPSYLWQPSHRSSSPTLSRPPSNPSPSPTLSHHTSCSLEFEPVQVPLATPDNGPFSPSNPTKSILKPMFPDTPDNGSGKMDGTPNRVSFVNTNTTTPTGSVHPFQAPALEEGERHESYSDTWTRFDTPTGAQTLVNFHFPSGSDDSVQTVDYNQPNLEKTYASASVYKKSCLSVTCYEALPVDVPPSVDPQRMVLVFGDSMDGLWSQPVIPFGKERFAALDDGKALYIGVMDKDFGQLGVGVVEESDVEGNINGDPFEVPIFTVDSCLTMFVAISITAAKPDEAMLTDRLGSAQSGNCSHHYLLAPSPSTLARQSMVSIEVDADQNTTEPAEMVFTITEEYITVGENSPMGMPHVPMLAPEQTLQASPSILAPTLTLHEDTFWEPARREADQIMAKMHEME